MGYVGDCMGRPRALQLTMALSVLGALASAFAVPIGDDPCSIFGFLTTTRFFLGVGVGGVYPLSATIASESSDNNNRGRNASLVFSMQGVANLLVPLLAWALLSAFGVPETGVGPTNLGLSWRLALGLGALPGILLAPFKTTARRPEQPPRPGTPEQSVAMVNPADNPPLLDQTPTTLLQALRMRRYWGKIVGTAGSWFLFDVTFYGNALFQATILEQARSHARGRSARATAPASDASRAEGGGPSCGLGRSSTRMRRALPRRTRPLRAGSPTTCALRWRSWR